MTRRGGNAPNSQRPDNQADTIAMNMELFDMPSIDIGDPDALRQRWFDYQMLCERYGSKILISGFCSAIGVSRPEILNWSAGKRTRLDNLLSPASAEILKKILQMFEVSWESAMQNNGYRNPVAGIFLGKNNFGYKDESQTIVKHEDAAQGPSKAELEAKYMAALPAEDVHVQKVAELPDAE